jgi:hypothetical protein
MKNIRQNRNALAPLRRLIGRPAIYTWTGNSAFNRGKGKRFNLLANILRDDEFQSFCAAIGFIEVNWALMEAQLDHWTQLSFVQLGGRDIENEMPKSFSRKSTFLRKSFERIPALSAFKDRGIDVLDRADTLSVTRNDLTHAVITSLESVDGKFEMMNRKLNKDGTHTTKNVQFDVRGFPELSLKLVLLGRDAIHLSHDLANEFLGH